MGTAAIQLAKLSGLTVVATASVKNFEYLKSLGADYVLPYSDPNTPAEIKKLTDGKLYLAYDAVCEKGSTQAIVDSFGDDANIPQGVKKEVILLLPVTSDLDDNAKSVAFHLIYAYALLGKAVTVYGVDLPADTAAREFSIHSFELLERLLREKKLKHQRVNVFGGLEKVPEGFEYMKSGKVSGEKIVYHPLETKP